MKSENIKDIDILIIKYLENKSTEEERRQIFQFLKTGDGAGSSKEVLLSLLGEFQEARYESHPVDFERIYKEIETEILERETKESEKQVLQKRTMLKRWILQGISVAAVFCIAFFLGSVFNRQNDKIVPELQRTSIAYTEIKAPLGARSEIRLNDGTEIILNAGSSIKYRSDFNLHDRDLVLEGEGYFKVARNIDIPLIVYAGGINIKATGTEFNVKAYSDEGIIETTLVKGEVEISQQGNRDKERILVLKPNQKAIYAEQTDKLTLEKIKEIEPQAVKTVKISSKDLLVSSKTDVEQVTAWTKNKLIIRSENLESLCVKLQRKYNVTFVFGDEKIKKHSFSGILLDETLQQVMDVIKLTAPVDYFIDRKTVLLFSKNVKTEKNPTDLNYQKTK